MLEEFQSVNDRNFELLCQLDCIRQIQIAFMNVPAELLFHIQKKVFGLSHREAHFLLAITF